MGRRGKKARHGAGLEGQPLTPIYKVTINGKEYEVNVGGLDTSPVEVTVDGVAYQVDLPDDGAAPNISPSVPGSSSASGRPAQPPARSAPPPPSAPTAPAPTGSGNAITAPIPGRIINVLVGVGDAVTAGQGVVLMESMKMEQTIASTRDGVVSNILVAAGDTVAFGQAMVELEEAGR